MHDLIINILSGSLHSMQSWSSFVLIKLQLEHSNCWYPETIDVNAPSASTEQKKKCC